MRTTQTSGRKPNIVLFAIDSLRADHMSCYGYPRLTTPHLDAFAREGTLFEKTYSAHIPTTPAYSSTPKTRCRASSSPDAWWRTSS